MIIIIETITDWFGEGLALFIGLALALIVLAGIVLMWPVAIDYFLNDPTTAMGENILIAGVPLLWTAILTLIGIASGNGSIVWANLIATPLTFCAFWGIGLSIAGIEYDLVFDLLLPYGFVGFCLAFIPSAIGAFIADRF